MREKISIIIPVYNIEKYIAQCLESIIRQTYDNLEIICVDDGSKDQSNKIIKEYQRIDDRIILIEQENQGLSGARNAGIQKATGQYIMFVDGDDWLSGDICEKAVQNIIKEEADCAIYAYVREFSEISKPKKLFDDRYLVFDKIAVKEKLHRRVCGLYGEELSEPENADSLVTAWGKLYKTHIIKENNIQFVDTKIIGTEDALFNLYVLGFVKKAVYFENYGYHYRKDNVTSLTSKYKDNLFAQWQNLYERMEQYIVDNNLDATFSTALNNRICLSLIGLGLNIIRSDLAKSEKKREISKILNSKRYAEAYKQLKLAYFPIYWKIFYWFAKIKLSTGVYYLLIAMQKMIGR